MSFTLLIVGSAIILFGVVIPERLGRVCFIDYDRDIALVADLKNATALTKFGVVRLIKEHGADEAEFAILISDAWHGKGLGSEL